MDEQIKKEDSEDTIFHIPETVNVHKEHHAGEEAFLGKSPYVPIIVILEGANMGKRFILDKSETIIGRRENAEIFLFDNLVSRRHSKITINPTDTVEEQFTAVIEDLDSMNGTYVNSVKINGPCVLKDGDKIQIGTFVLCFFAKLREELDLEDHLLKLAQKDFLTGLYNRAYFTPILEFEFKRFKRYKNPLSLIMFDIDFFKNVNDTYGHDMGDFVLQGIAAILKSVVRGSDLAVRYGGEEFAILLMGTSLEDASVIAERIRQVIRKHIFKCGEIEIQITASFGLACCNEHYTSPQDLIIKSDQALYAAKKSGRDNVKICRDDNITQQFEDPVSDDDK